MRLPALQARGQDIKSIKFEATPEGLDDRQVHRQPSSTLAGCASSHAPAAVRRVPCPYCGRKFAKLTADRHIPACKNTQVCRG